MRNNTISSPYSRLLNIDTPIPYFATISYAFAPRFPSEIFEKIFAWILGATVAKGFIKAGAVLIYVIHVKASANRNKYKKQLALKAARAYDKSHQR